jgi:homoserine O-succinyltransferase/O-acetyltransferase
MPLIYDPNSLPTIGELWERNPLSTIWRQRAKEADIRALRVWVMNNMTDESLVATERQICRLLWADSTLQIEPVFFTAEWVPRSEIAKNRIQKHYTSFLQIQEDWLDALIISGANFWNDPIDTLPFYPELTWVMDWAEKNVASTMTLCLATHVLMKHKHKIDRVLNMVNNEPRKIWWVYDHIIDTEGHPLVSDMNTDIPVVHSRWNDISRDQFENSWHTVLISSKAVWVHLAVDRSFQWVMAQWHGEYDTVSLAREYRRDRKLWKTPEPENYMTDELRALDLWTDYPNEALVKLWKIKNNWKDSAQIVMRQWLSIVLNLTHWDIHKQYMDGIDKDDPLGSMQKLRKSS